MPARVRTCHPRARGARACRGKPPGLVAAHACRGAPLGGRCLAGRTFRPLPRRDAVPGRTFRPPPRRGVSRSGTAKRSACPGLYTWTRDLPNRSARRRLPRGRVDRDLLPRAEFDVEAALETVRPICEDVRHRGATAALIEYGERFDGVAARAAAGARRRRSREALDAARPGGARGAGGVDPPGPHGARATSAAPTSPRRSCPAAPSPSGGCRSRRVGLYVPGGLAVYPSQRGHERRAGPGGRRRVARRRLAAAEGVRRPARTRRSWPPARCSASTRCTPSAAPRPIAMFAYGDADRRAAEPVDLVTGPGNIYVAAAKRLLTGRDRHRRRGRADRDRGPRRRHRRPGARRRRPDQPGRARPAGRLGAGHRLARRWPTRSRPSWRARSPRPSTSSGSRTALAGRAVRRSCWSTTSTQGLRRRRRLRRRAPGDPDRATPRAVAARVRNAGAIFVGPYAPVSLGDYCAGLQPRAAHRRLRPPLLGPVGAVLPARHPRRRLRPRRRCAEVAAARRRARRRRGPARARRRRDRAVRPERRSAATGDARSPDDLPLRDDLRGADAVRRAAARRAGAR